MQIKTIIRKTPNFRAFFCGRLYNKCNDKHVDTHAQKVIGYLHKRSGGYCGINVDLFEKERQQSPPKGSDKNQ